MKSSVTMKLQTTSILRPTGWRHLAVMFSLLAISAWGQVKITQVIEDGRPRALALSSADSQRIVRPVVLRSGNQQLGFAFEQSNPNVYPAARLRFKLEGWDTDWRDPPVTIQMRVTLQFRDTNNATLDIDSFAMNGETPGWRGTVEKSDYAKREEQATAPGRATQVGVVILSQGPESVVGLAAVDSVRLRIRHVANGSKMDEYDLSVKKGTDLDNPMGTPANWSRQGTRAGMSKLAIRPSPSPHPVLVLHDEDALRFSTWAQVNSVPIDSGDQVYLSWECAHSIGNSGPWQVNYPKLKPGRYWFRLAAAKANGELTGTEVSLPIEVVPPLTQSLKFWLVMLGITGVAGILLGRAVQRTRMKRRMEAMKRLNALERERARIARDLHDDIGAGLTEIAMRSNLIWHDLQHKPTPDTLKHVERVCQSATELTRSVDEIVWAVNPANDTLPRFANYLAQTTEQFVNATELRVRFDIPQDFPNIELNGKDRHLIFLAVREALNNAVKHSKAKLIRLELKLMDHQLRLVVEDDGCGFTTDQSPKPDFHEGLAGMRRRIEEVGGRFEIASRPGGGTRIEFTVQLNRKIV